MITKETDFLPLLKDELDKKYKESYPDCSLKITDWRQQEILRFQDLMQDVVKGRISEKWFYTHIKPLQNSKMPRIDTLNLLAEFLGYVNWSDFKKERIPELKLDEIKHFSFFRRHKISLVVFIVILAGVGISYSTGIFNKSEKYEFCFADADTKEAIISNSLEVKLIYEDESPQIVKLNENKCFEVETNNKIISFEVKAPYYKTDTITRKLNGEKNEIIYLKQDDYALMIHVFSTSKIEDWEKQRKRLDKMIADEAEIYQIDKKERGIEIYNKEEFIDKMTIPLSSLNNIEIIELTYEKDKIIMMRFIQN